jgi:maltose O-acetyltransferase
VLFHGKGKIVISKTVKIGYKFSQGFTSQYGYIEARNRNSIVKIGENVWINNNISIVSEDRGIEIGSSTLIGHDVEIIDSDFHELSPNKRIGGVPKSSRVKIGKNVFIGNYVKITKGVIIGDNSVVAMGSVVVTSFPSNCVIGGNPAKIIKQLGDDK